MHFAHARILAICTIAAIFAVGVSQSRLDDQRSSDRLKLLGVATLMYAQDHHFVLPNTLDPAALHNQLAPYVDRAVRSAATRHPNGIHSVPVAASVFVEPGPDVPYLANPALSSKSVDGMDPRLVATTVLFYEPSPRADGGRFVAFVDGHVQGCTKPEWASLKTSNPLNAMLR